MPEYPAVTAHSPRGSEEGMATGWAPPPFHIYVRPSLERTSNPPKTVMCPSLRHDDTTMQPASEAVRPASSILHADLSSEPPMLFSACFK